MIWASFFTNPSLSGGSASSKPFSLQKNVHGLGFLVLPEGGWAADISLFFLLMNLSSFLSFLCSDAEKILLTM
ncbi:MAG: hypothetical protein A3A12_03605 [Candidatus Staskawiczbacteria bacterium RIFCSPLOWO2_01_FULL_43_17b]|nr:MAG: hypothetical protein A3A12_03605 [Candidatus Staskawiczbacteria bacterium RIFCSPLOWO2_01_FULL_43_17b]